MPVQTRSEIGGLVNFPTIREAMDYAKEHEDVWKISFQGPDGSRVRLVRKADGFCYENLMVEVEKLAGSL